MYTRTRTAVALVGAGLIVMAVLWLAGQNLAVARVFGVERAAMEGRERAEVVGIFPSETGWQAMVTWQHANGCSFTRNEVRPGLFGWKVNRTSIGQIPCEGGFITWGHGMTGTGPMPFQAYAGEVRDPRVAKVTVVFVTRGEVPATLGPHTFLLYEAGAGNLSTMTEIRAYDQHGALLQRIDRSYGPPDWGQ